jgi:spore maturation protein CgeB
MKIVIFGLTITSSWGNGHATTYRSLSKALARRGHSISFVEKDVEWYRSNRDLPEPEYCRVCLYSDWLSSRRALLRMAADADVIVIGSYFPDAITATRELLDAGSGPLLFYDIDTPITLAGLRRNPDGTEYLTPDLIPQYATYLSFTGGPALRELETQYGSPRAVPFYCSVDPEIYRPVTPKRDFVCDLSYLGTYAHDRQVKLTKLLCHPAAQLPAQRFVVAGPQYPSEVTWPQNVVRMIHLSPSEHPAFYSSSRFTLNLTREDMVAAGYSPSVRLFEASACGAAIVSDNWLGLDDLLTPGEEILLPKDEYDVVQILTQVSDSERKAIGARARARILAQHTSEHRARQFEQIVATLPVGSRLP